MRRLTIVLGVLAALLAGLVGVAAPALAAPPMQLSGPITDDANALSGGDRDRVQKAFDNLSSAKGVRAYVVYVPTFDGTDPAVWARQTFEQSGLGGKDVLLAVATEARKYDIHVGSGVSRSSVSGVNSAVRSNLSNGEWADAAVTMADGLAGRSSGASSGAGSGLATLGVVAVLLVLAGGGYLFFRGRRRRREARPALPAGPAPQPQQDPHAGVPTEQLNYRASSALLDLDEQVRTAGMNLEVARSYYGEDAVPGFPEALEQSRGELARAFTIRQELDDDIPEDEPTQRRMLTELLALTDAAGKRLSEQSEAIAALREQERTAPETVEKLAHRIGELQQRLPQQEKRLADLQQRYAGSALASVADNVGQAGVRLQAASQAVDSARQDQADGASGRAVGRLRAAEGAVQQSATLLDAIDRLADELAAAEQRIAAARAETEADLAEARSLVDGGDRSGLQPLIARAEAELASADAALRPRDGSKPDPLGALRRLEEADAALDQALVGARDAQAQRRRAADGLDQALLTARSAVAAADDFISARRGAVGPTARTRLAEAQRHLAAAERLSESDPQTALREAQQADQLAQYALDMAQGDVDQWSQRTGYGPGYGGRWGGGYGGGWGAPRGGSGLGWGLGGLLLGGLLFGDHDHHGGGGDWGGGGGGDWGGGFGGDFGGGDFGGDFGGGGDF